MKQLFLILLFLCSISAFSQDKINIKKLSYGVTVSPIIPVFPGFTSKGYISDKLKPNMGLNAGIYASFNKQKNHLYSKALYRYLLYKAIDNNFKVSSQDVNLQIGVKRSLKNPANTNFVIAYSPSFNINTTETYAGRQFDSFPPPNNLTKQLSNRFSNSVYIGLEFEYKDKGTMEVGYTHSLKRTYFENRVDAVPHHFSFAYNLNFNAKAEISKDIIELRSTLKRLENDTLYFINKTCENELPNIDLEKLLNTHYAFSNFKVVKPNELVNLKKQTNVIMFALVGAHYASDGDIPSTGIFLLDKNLNNLEYPYPHHVRLKYDFNSNTKQCIESIENAALLIRKLNSELEEAKKL